MASTEPEKIAPPPEAPAAEPKKVAPPSEAPTSEPEKVALQQEVPNPEPEVAAPPADVPASDPEKAAPPPETLAPVEYFVVIDVILRVLLFASTLTSVVVMVTSNQTKLLPVPPFPFPVLVPAKFSHSSAFTYFVAALSVAGLYSVITSIVSFLALLKPTCYTKVLVHFVIIDVLMLGIVASATGAAGAVAYIGLKGNSHVRWQKVCNVYGKFCQHIGGSVAVSLFASAVLVLLVILSVHSLSRKIPT